jgi:hypothetical protein
MAEMERRCYRSMWEEGALQKWRWRGGGRGGGDAMWWSHDASRRGKKKGE